MKRRTFLATAGATALARPSIAAGTKPLIFVPQANLTSLDPVWTTATVTRNFALMVYDMLYGRDEAFVPRPQMVEGHVIDDDGKRWTMTLRDGLLWHDGTKVLARDCLASLQRWMKRDAVGATINLRVDAIEAPDDRTLVWRLRKPFPLLPHFLSKVQPQPVMMPARLAATDPFKQVTEIVGSGPFRFLDKEYVSGSFAAFAKFDRYVPRNEPPSYTAGGHHVLLDRVEWRVIPDSATAANALTAGEVDWLELPQPDLVPMLKRPAGGDDRVARSIRHGGRAAAEPPERADQQCGRAAGDVRRDRPAGGDDGGDGRGPDHMAGADGIFPADLEIRQRRRDGFRPQAAQRR